jgi:hypothetical protein
MKGMMMTDNEALQIYSGPRRTYEIFCVVGESPRSLNELRNAIPGGDGFIESIVEGMVEANLIALNQSAEYELAERGQQAREVLDRLSQEQKTQAYTEAWGTPPPEGY